MSILLTPATRAIVQGGTGRIGARQTEWMLKAGTRLVGAVTPGKGGTELHGLPVFDSVAEAVERVQANASVSFVPAAYVRGAAMEAVQAGLRLVVVIAEHVPVYDTLEIREACRESGTVMIGPNTPGIITPGVGKLGIMPANVFSRGHLGMLSRSGTLAYEVAGILQAAGIGVTTMVGVGGDPIIGTDMAEYVPYFAADPETKGLLVVGEIGGTQEERLAAALGDHPMPACAYIAGRTAPAGKRMGHAGALMSAHQGSVAQKTGVLERTGIRVAESPRLLPAAIREALAG
ncbi:MAG: succinate--CoA ligase subunit alpha [Candidatus Bipolaricaulis sp.]|nr:succinate--CoA ligase subunit alpha [Candidatus Bipolaricaulis sp.]MDD5219618.1 succinate--CoA ligase subunit alpha [Candidatus Bipolaricaulis sp.]